MFLEMIYQDLLVKTRNAEQLMQENDTVRNNASGHVKDLRERFFRTRRNKW